MDLVVHLNGLKTGHSGSLAEISLFSPSMLSTATIRGFAPTSFTPKDAILSKITNFTPDLSGQMDIFFSKIANDKPSASLHVYVRFGSLGLF